MKNIFLLKVTYLALLLLCPGSLYAATFTVSNNSNAGFGSLRQAVIHAQDGDEIRFNDSVVGTISLISEIKITNDISIYGNPHSRVVINGSNKNRIFFILPNAKVSMFNLTIVGGTGRDGEYLDNDHGDNNSDSKWSGGGIKNQGELTLFASTVSGNTTTPFQAGGGGGLSNMPGATLYIINSTVSGNSTKDGGKGGAIYNLGALYLTNSTISNNFSPASTGGIYNEGTVQIANSIVAGNSGAVPEDIVSTGSIVSNGHNFIGVGATGNPSDKTFLNTSTSLSGLIGVLKDNGGPTYTHALSVTSPAIDMGRNQDAKDRLGQPLLNDQRGRTFNRIVNGIVDIGSYEAQSQVPSQVQIVDSTGDFLGATCTRPESCTLRAAINEGQSPVTILLPESFLDSTITLTLGPLIIEGKTVTINAFEDEEPPPVFDVVNNLAALNLSVRMTNISANNLSRVFVVAANSALNLSNVRISNGFAADNGAAIKNNGSLNFSRVIFEGNQIFAANSNAILGGAAIFNEGSMDIRDAAFVQNEVRSSFSNSALAGGAIYNLRGSLSLRNTSFIGNSVQVDANALASNMARAYGAALYSLGSLNLDAVFLNDNFAIAKSQSLRGAQAIGGALYIQAASGQDAARLKQVTMARNFVRAQSIGSLLDANENALAEGGAIYNARSTFALNMISSQFTDNLAIANNEVASRDAIARGAAIANYGNLQADNSFLRANEVRADSSARSTAEAAAIYVAENAFARLNQADLISNMARAGSQSLASSQSIARGAAIASYGSLSITTASFSKNSAVAQALANASNSLRPVANAFGAAMYIAPTSMSDIRNSTFDNNLVSASVKAAGDAFAFGAAIANEGSFNMLQSTVTQNSAVASGENALRQGGGVYNAISGNFEARSSTFASNSALSGANFFNAGNMLVRNSAFASPAIGQNFSADQTSAISALSSYNFADDQSAASFAIVAANLRLQALADNGGFTQTMMPQRESILVDAGDPLFDINAVPYDQRGFGFPRAAGVRGAGANGTGPVDVGAVELADCIANNQCQANSTCSNNLCYRIVDASLCTPDISFTYSRDQDGDGIGDNSAQVTACVLPVGFVVASAVSDNCPTVANADQADSNANGIGNACEQGAGCDARGKGSSSGDSLILLSLLVLFAGFRVRKLASILGMATLFIVPHAFAGAINDPAAVASLEKITAEKVQINDATGAVTFAKFKKSVAKGVIPLSVADLKKKAQVFLKTHGRAFGVSDSDAELQLSKDDVDQIGERHQTYKQLHKGLSVFGGELKVHFDSSGEISIVNGAVVPDLNLDVTPGISAEKASAIAIGVVGLKTGALLLQVPFNELMIYRTGMAKGEPGTNHLVWKVEVGNGVDIREFVFVDAKSGKVVDQLTGTYDNIHRSIYNGENNYKNGILFWDEANPFFPVGASQNDIDRAGKLIDISGQFYYFFRNYFNRVSYDGNDAFLKLILNRTQGCPNASWNGTYVSVCPGLEVDDVISHEWAHAILEKTSGLVYAWQAGALNESYSDIWGETIDLINSEGPNDNVPRVAGQCPCTADDLGVVSCVPGKSTRWLVGEDNQPSQLPFRDMYDPLCFKNPQEISGNYYSCNGGDFGSVHTNSSVPNRAFALLVDGDNQTVGIGHAKAASIYWRAQSVYEGPFTTFKEHANYLAQSCNDLVGKPILNFNGATLPPITVAECLRVAEVSQRVLLTNRPCFTIPLLNASAPPAIDCPRKIFFANFLNGEDGFTKTATYSANHSNLPNFETNQVWKRVTVLPDYWQGGAFFAPNSREGSVDVGKDASNVISLISPSIPLPNSLTGKLVFTFDHNIASEEEYDGGNVKISTDNGVTWSLIPASKFLFNPYNLTLLPGPDNTNPLAGQPAFSGSDFGDIGGSWVQSQVDLTDYKGQNIKLRFDFGSDVASGVIGWFVTNVTIYNTNPTTSVQSQCGDGVCAATGVSTCTNGRLVDSCIPNPPAIFYADADGDGVGTSNITLQRCVRPQGYAPKTVAVDNCPLVVNPNQADENGNGIGDACERETKAGGGCNAIVGTGNMSADWLTYLLFALVLAAYARRKGGKSKPDAAS